jgi:hypothetical protein
MTSDSANPEKMRFELLKGGLADGAARLGRLAMSGRQEVATPDYFAIASRGAVPHITPDNLRAHVPVGGTYMALEDCKLVFFIAPSLGLLTRLQSLSALKKTPTDAHQSTALLPRHLAPVPCTTSLPKPLKQPRSSPPVVSRPFLVRQAAQRRQSPSSRRPAFRTFPYSSIGLPSAR